MPAIDFKNDMRELFGLERTDSEQKEASAKENDEKESKNVASEAESEKVAEASDEREEKGKPLEEERSAHEGDESERRKALEDALRGEEKEEKGEEKRSEEKEQKEEIEPPEHWKRSDREMFSNLPTEAKKFLVDQSKHFQGDYMRKVNNLQGIVDALDPIKEDLARRGVSTAQAVRSLVANHMMMQERPAEAIKSIFNDLKVDPLEFVSKWDEIGDLNEALKESAKRTLSEDEKAAIEKNKETVASRLNQWATEGNKKHAMRVEGIMAEIVSRHIKEGTQIPHIDDIYEDACWAHPEVREELLKERALEMSVEEKRRLRRSKKAADAGIQTESEGEQKELRSEDMTQREELAHLLRKKAG